MDSAAAAADLPEKHRGPAREGGRDRGTKPATKVGAAARRAKAVARARARAWMVFMGMGGCEGA